MTLQYAFALETASYNHNDNFPLSKKSIVELSERVKLGINKISTNPIVDSLVDYKCSEKGMDLSCRFKFEPYSSENLDLNWYEIANVQYYYLDNLSILLNNIKMETENKEWSSNIDEFTSNHFK